MNGWHSLFVRCPSALRALVLGAVFVVAVPAAAQPTGTPVAASPPKVLRLSLPAPETGFDFAQVSDLYSHTMIAHIFESLYSYDHLARPFLIRPATAAAMPEVSADFRTYTVRLKPGTHFADDAAFKGRKRELVAADYVYSIKRIFDPKWKSPHYSGFVEDGIVGIEALRAAAEKPGGRFDYDRDIEGLRALDRYTLQVKLAQPRPRFIYRLADMPAMAREVVEAYPDTITEHPVGTGPYRLTEWRRSSRMVFERNPNFREQVYDAVPNADDAEGQALLAKLKGRRLPMIDRVEVSVVQESQPRWLAFLNDEFDAVGVPLEFANQAVPNGKLAPNLEKRGIRMFRGLGSDVTMFYFNMEDPVFGGYTPERVALRRAIGLATDVQREIKVARRGQAVPAQSGIAPFTYGYDPELKTENGTYDMARARALLDLYGYVDKDGDGWREQPNGKPLVMPYATQPDQISRQFDELWKKNLDQLGIRMRFDARIWPEQLKQARAGQLTVWQLGSSSTTPDGQSALELSYGPGAGGANLARFKLPAFDAVYLKVDRLPDGPERLAAFREANRLITAYMPYKFNVHRLYTDLTQPWVIGYRRPTFWRNTWHMLDIERSPAR